MEVPRFRWWHGAGYACVVILGTLLVVAGIEEQNQGKGSGLVAIIAGLGMIAGNTATVLKLRRDTKARRNPRDNAVNNWSNAHPWWTAVICLPVVSLLAWALIQA